MRRLPFRISSGLLLCCVLWQDSFLSRCSPQEGENMSAGECRGTLTKFLGLEMTYDGLAFHPGGRNSTSRRFMLQTETEINSSRRLLSSGFSDSLPVPIYAPGPREAWRE